MSMHRWVQSLKTSLMESEGVSMVHDKVSTIKASGRQRSKTDAPQLKN